jgi:hypothetical protein
LLDKLNQIVLKLDNDQTAGPATNLAPLSVRSTLFVNSKQFREAAISAHYTKRFYR